MKVVVNLRYLGLLLAGLAFGCAQTKQSIPAGETLFTQLPAEATGIDFENTVTNSREFNIYTYRNFYNGGGVAIGDVNNDGRADVYFTANMGPNRLYLNQGDTTVNDGEITFADVTESAGVQGSRAWSTGVTMADVNGDGWLDIYVCNSGDVKGDDRQNELFINQGDGTFQEMAQTYGLDDSGFSTQAAFFDYDRDGDLDVYVLNNSFRAIGSFNLKSNERPVRDAMGGDKLYRNDGTKFTDVSEEANIYGSVIGFGLGVLVSDLNQDSWPDIYICNDFFERDYLYMNNGDGSFREELTQQMQSISMASMGADAADLTGDGYPEIFVTEMLPKSEERLKTSMTFENWNKYQHNVKHDYYHQFTRNMLHLNNGRVGKQGLSFKEVGRLAGVEATDWSWGALMVDLDHNGYKDIYVTNGIYQDILNQDYLKYISNEAVVRSVVTEDGVNYEKLIEVIPSQPISNVAYSGQPDLGFQDHTRAWGLDQPSFSNGSAYGDLDNDGDLDLVVNNVNMPPFVYRNETSLFYPDRHFLKVKLKGEGHNTRAIGAKLLAVRGDYHYYLEQMPTRGFQSSVDEVLNLGLGELEKLDSLVVTWPSGKTTVRLDVPVDQMLTLSESEALQTKQAAHTEPVSVDLLFEDITDQYSDDFSHEENVFSDFDKDALLFHMASTEGPHVAVGDVNGDQRDDVFIGGAKDRPGKLFIQQANGQLKRIAQPALEQDQRCEDVDALFFDADNDRDLDLYVVSGGNEYPSSSSALADRLYLNDGKGNFRKSEQLLPTSRFESTSCVAAADFDRDGDHDLFVGVRLRDRLYGVPQNGYLLENDGKGKFTNVSETKAPQLAELGHIKDASWTDYNGDGQLDLLVVGEWMSIRLFENNNGSLQEVTEPAGLSHLEGWWNTVVTADLDQDGDLDIVAGNHGLNSRFRASTDQPISCYINDFDRNGTVEQILCTYNGDTAYPLVLQHDLVAQLPGLKKKYLKNESYKKQQITDIFSEAQLQSAIRHQVTTLESMVMLNQGDGTFQASALPQAAQLSPVYAISVEDLDQDGHVDILLGGNLYEAKPEVGRYDANQGVFLRGNGDGTFSSVLNRDSGLLVEGQVRDIRTMRLNGREVLLVVRNNAKVQVFTIAKGKEATL